MVAAAASEASEKRRVPTAAPMSVVKEHGKVASTALKMVLSVLGKVSLRGCSPVPASYVDRVTQSGAQERGTVTGQSLLSRFFTRSYRGLIEATALTPVPPNSAQTVYSTPETEAWRVCDDGR